MKNLFALLIVFCLSSSIGNSSEICKSSLSSNYTSQDVTKAAQFPGGEKKMKEWIKENLRHPKKIKKYGTVVVEFTVKKNGTLSNFVVKKELEEETNFSAIECLMGMPKWEPAEKDGKKVSSKVSLPVRFIRE